MTQLRAVIYARYSSDLQRVDSIEDQNEVCKRFIAGKDWQLVDTYADAALSGASRHRPSYQRLIADARQKKFDIVVCEAVDRLGRRLADTADLQDTLAFLGIRLFTPSVGEVTAMHIGIMGMMAQMTLKDLAEKTKRGQLGRVRKGKVAGGLAFGYRVVGGEDGDGGHRRIEPAEATVIKRIFHEYAAGKAPEKTARDLNAEGIPGPGGRPWSNSTIRGQSKRGTGILNNSVYVGRIEWNRCSYVKDPSTGKRVARPNPEELWEKSEVPHLRIIADDLWTDVKQRQLLIRQSLRWKAGLKAGAVNHDLNATRRSRFLLSGLLKCDACGGNFTATGKDRLGCSTRHRQGTCKCTVTVSRKSMEDRVLIGLKERLVTPELVDVFVAEFQAEYARQRSEALSGQGEATSQIAKIDKKMKAMLQAIEDGYYQPEMKERINALSADKARLMAQLTSLGVAEKVILHPRMHELYLRKVRELEALLSGEGHESFQARDIIRSMITKVTISQGRGENSYNAVLYGDLATILNACADAKLPKSEGSQLPDFNKSGSQPSVVAGARCHLYRTTVKYSYPP